MILAWIVLTIAVIYLLLKFWEINMLKYTENLLLWLLELFEGPLSINLSLVSRGIQFR